MSSADRGVGRTSRELIGFGPCVDVRSADDLPAMGELIADRHAVRRAVLFTNMTSATRRPLIAAIEQLGVDLRRFTPSDKAALRRHGRDQLDARQRAAGLAIGLLNAPFSIAIPLRGRRNSMFELVNRPSTSTTP